MGSIFETVIAFGIVFGILVFAHEFGHFIMAKLMGVKVEVFSWGYGKRIFGIKMGDTDYRVSVFPLGGYVKFSGEEVFDQKSALATHDFMAKKRWQRFLVIFNGPVMNIVLAIIFFAFINVVGVTVPEYQDQKPVIGWIEPGSPAEKANLQIDDEILSINNKKAKTWSDVDIAVGTKPEKLVILEIKRGEEVLNIEMKTEKRTRYDLGYAGFFGKILIQVNMISPNSAAEKGGLQPGDIILAIEGEPVYYYQFVEIIEKSAGKKLEFLIERAGQKRKLHITPRREGNIGKIGILQVPKSVIKKYGFFAAVHESLKGCIKLSFLIFNFLKDLVSGEISARQIAGPIEIANISYAAFRMGFIAMVTWIALISLQIGILNLLPIPVLDGGHILVLSLEGIFRRDFSPKVKQIVIQFGFVIFIILIIFIILNDVSKSLPNGWQSFIPWKN
ncbi:MAG: RIP metalloprotease RseP [Candidatus Aminicenantaceae bacterium]